MMLSAVAVAWPRASEAVTVKLTSPLTVGVPLIVPLVGVSVRPAGSAPCVMAKVIGAMPFTVVTVSE